MAKFRKKPVVIEAFEIPPPDNLMTTERPPHWLLDAIAKGGVRPIRTGGLIIDTLEGAMTGNVGDWVIQGVKGELYPCKPDIFAATYDPVGAAEQQQSQSSDDDTDAKPKITGYRQLTDEELTLINESKALAETCGTFIGKLRAFQTAAPGQLPRNGSLDQRWVSIGATHLQEGFMAVVRGIAQPSTF